MLILLAGQHSPPPPFLHTVLDPMHPSVTATAPDPPRIPPKLQLMDVPRTGPSKQHQRPAPSISGQWVPFLTRGKAFADLHAMPRVSWFGTFHHVTWGHLPRTIA